MGVYVWVWVGVRGGRLEDMFSAVIICNTYGFWGIFYSSLSVVYYLFKCF